MADFFTTFCFPLTATTEQYLWLQEHHMKNVSEYKDSVEVFQDEVLPRSGNPEKATVHVAAVLKENHIVAGELNFELQPDNIVHVYAQFNGDIEYTTQVLQAYLNHFNLSDVIDFTYASTCSKMRPNEFGGGAVIVSKDEIDNWSTKEILADLVIQHRYLVHYTA